MLSIETFVCNPFSQNTFLVYNQETKNAFVVDAGMYEEDERLAFQRFIKQKKLSLQYVIQTHLHLDHIFGNRFLVETYNPTVYYHKDDEFFIPQLESQGVLFGLPILEEHKMSTSTSAITQKIKLPWDDGFIDLIPAPGHSPGGLLVSLAQQKILFSGDLLFRGGVGRTDLEGGNMRQLLDSLKSMKEIFPPETVVYPGHGMETTLATELRLNRFFN